MRQQPPQLCSCHGAITSSGVMLHLRSYSKNSLRIEREPNFQSNGERDEWQWLRIEQPRNGRNVQRLWKQRWDSCSGRVDSGFGEVKEVAFLVLTLETSQRCTKAFRWRRPGAVQQNFVLAGPNTHAFAPEMRCVNCGFYGSPSIGRRIEQK